MERRVNEHSLTNVMEYFIDRYKLKDDEELSNYEWYIDPVKQKVFIIMHIKKIESLKK